MTKNTSRILAPAAVATVGIAVIAGLLAGKPAPQPQPQPPSSPPAVEVIDVTPQTLSLAVRSQGTVTPRRQSELAAEVGGRVVWTADSYAAGGFFETGDVLLRIDQRDYEIALTRARARVAEARQTLATEKGRALQARREWRDLGSEEANALFLRKPHLANAEAQLAAAQAEQRRAELDLARTAVTAPYAGRVNEVAVDLGQYVSPGTAVADIYATDAVEVRLPLSDRQLALLALPLSGDTAGDGIPVTLSGQFAGRRWQWPGRIVRTEARIDNKTRLLHAIAEVRQPFATSANSQRPPLNIGQFVEATISGKPADDALLLPPSALRAGDLLWVIDESGRLQIQPVQVLQAGPDAVAVSGEFNGPLQVVASYLANPVAGMLLSPVPQASGQEVAQ